MSGSMAMQEPFAGVVEDAEEVAAFVSGNQRPVAIPPKAVAGVDLVK